MTLVNLPRFYKGVTIVPAIFKEDSIFPSLCNRPIEEATSMFKSMILEDVDTMEAVARIKDNRLPVVVALQKMVGRKINMLNVGWIWHPENGTLTPIAMPMTIRKATVQDSLNKNQSVSVWSVRVPLVNSPITMFGYPETNKYGVKEIVTHGLNNVLVFKSTNPEFFEGSIVKDVEDSDDEDEESDNETIQKNQNEGSSEKTSDNVIEMDVDLHEGSRETGTSSTSDGTSNDRVPIPPPMSNNSTGLLTKRKQGDTQPPGSSSASSSKKGPGTSFNRNGDPNPGSSSNNQDSNNPTHKLDSPFIYHTTLNRIDETGRLFNHFFARFFQNSILPDMNNNVYHEVSSFDAVHILNHGAYMIKTSTLTPSPAIVAAFTTAETLMPEVPDNLFLPLIEAQLAVRRYGTVIFSQAGIGNVGQLNSFFNDLSNVGPNSQYRDMQNAYRDLAQNVGQAFDFNNIRSNLSVSDIANLQADSNDLLPLNLVMRLIRDFMVWRERSNAALFRRERLELFYSIHMGVAKMGRASPRQCRKYANELTQIIGTEVALDGALISTVWRYNKPFISEQSAFRFFSRLRTFVSEEEAVHFHHMFLYAAHQEMSCMKFIIQAIHQFPDFPWYLARSTFRADWNVFESICQEMWNRPYMAYTGIEARFGSQNYKSLAYLAWCLIIHFGTTRDVAARGFVGFNRSMPDSIKRKVEELLRYYQNNVVISLDLTREYDIHERRTIFDQMESNVQKYAHAAHLFDEKLQTLRGNEDLLQVSNACLVEAEEKVSNIRESQLLPVRSANRENGQQQQFQLDARNRDGDEFNF